MPDLIDFMEAELASQATGLATDAPRLTKHLEIVRAAMLGGDWFSLEQLAGIAGCTTQSASARVRDLRKPAFGSHTVERKKVPGSKGLYLYRIAIPT